jgi:hypothetical protein
MASCIGNVNCVWSFANLVFSVLTPGIVRLARAASMACCCSSDIEDGGLSPPPAARRLRTLSMMACCSGVMAKAAL